MTTTLAMRMESRSARLRGKALTQTEEAVLALLADGLRNHEVATRIGVNPHTVGTHISAINHKLGARTVAHAVALHLNARHHAQASAGVTY